MLLYYLPKQGEGHIHIDNESKMMQLHSLPIANIS